MLDRMTSSQTPPFARWLALPRMRRLDGIAALAGGGSLLGGWLLLRLFPAWSFDGFARGAAHLVSFFTGASLYRGEAGWMVPIAGAPVSVTVACSATDYFLIVAALIGFQAVRSGISPFVAAGAGLAVAAPLTILVNAVRIITVAHAHPWFISRFPAAYESFLHMTTGAAVFLPSLVALNLVLEAYGRHRCPHRT